MRRWPCSRVSLSMRIEYSKLRRLAGVSEARVCCRNPERSEGTRNLRRLAGVSEARACRRNPERREGTRNLRRLAGVSEARACRRNPERSEGTRNNSVREFFEVPTFVSLTVSTCLRQRGSANAEKHCLRPGR